MRPGDAVLLADVPALQPAQLTEALRAVSLHRSAFVPDAEGTGTVLIDPEATGSLAIIDEVGSDNLFVQYDLYHAQRMEGELIATMTKNLARIGHIQLADNPGRNEPGTGEIAYDRVFAALDRIGKRRWRRRVRS